MWLNLESPSRWREEKEYERPPSKGRGRGRCELGENQAVILEEQGDFICLRVVTMCILSCPHLCPFLPPSQAILLLL